MDTFGLYDIRAYDFALPEGKIAQNPAVPRDSSKLMVLDKKTGEILHSRFSSLGDFLSPSDLLVLNDTKVIPARLQGKKRQGGGKAEILLLGPASGDGFSWEALVKPGRRLPPGTAVILGDGTEVTVGKSLEDGIRQVEFPAGTDVAHLLQRVGETPLPPYITESTAPASAYQTIFAKRDGSAAAPTASLHFTEDLLENLRLRRGVSLAWVTLHVGLGTFRPVITADIRQHRIHEEFCSVPPETRDLIRETEKRGGRVIAAGTTVARTLESMAEAEGEVAAGTRRTRLFIFPGYGFKIVKGLITNFHLPRSSLLMLVAAFAGYENTMKAYESAVACDYRFFSFGDAMLIR